MLLKEYRAPLLLIDRININKSLIDKHMFSQQFVIISSAEQLSRQMSQHCMDVPLLGFETDPIIGNDEDEALECALQYGYRYISSNGLPKNEIRIGKVLQHWLQQGGIKREDVFISTKLPLSDTKPEDVCLRIQESLSNLHLDYIDLCLIEVTKNNIKNKKDERTDLLKFWAEMEALVSLGKAKHIGASNVCMDDINEIVEFSSIKPSCVELEMQLDSQQCESVDFCRRNGIALVARITLENCYGDLIVNAVIKKIARKHDKSIPQILLKYLTQSGFSVIPKHTRKSRLKEYAEVCKFSLDGTDMRQLDVLNIESYCRVYDCAALKRSVNIDLQIN